jgi:LemA protein
MASAGHFGQDSAMLFGLLVFGAIVAIVFAFVATYNGLVAAADKATRAWNDLEALLRQRHDEIPKIVEMCEPYFGGERALLDRLLEERAAVFAAQRTRDADRLNRAEVALRGAAAALMAKVETHADLVAAPAFGLLLQRQATLDLEIKDRRDRYNDAAQEYNAAINGAPGKLVARIGEFSPLKPLDFEPKAS